MTFTTLKAAKETISLTNRNSKMPGSAFSSSAKHCRVGSRLVNQAGSICKGCYALRIMNMRPNVESAWTANYEKSVHLIATNPAKWIAACVFQINRFAEKSGEPYHRWYDSGDLDSVEQLAAICQVAIETPHVKHWLPTRELAIVKAYKGPVPANLVIRLSAPMIDQRPVKGANTSTVHKDAAPHGHVCPAPSQGGSCGTGDNACRACWSHDVANVSYKKH